MTEKEEIISLITRLKKSVEARGSKEGIKLYDSYIVDLEDKTTDRAQLMEDLNRTLTGIEVHGYFTDEELLYVTKLRELDFI